jgi:chromosome partitioning protein
VSARVVAVANHKGGVGKTTTTLHLASAMTECGAAVLVVDLDPQGCLTFALGLDPDALDPSVHDVVLGRVPLVDTVVQHEEMDLVPANMDLSGVEVALLARDGRESVLRDALADLLDSYDVVLLDCPPSLGVLTVNALTAAHEVVIPVQCETLAHRGVGQLLDTVDDVVRLTNRDLTVRGIIATRFDARAALSREVLRDLVARYGLALVGPPVRASVHFAEAPIRGRSLMVAGPGSRGAGPAGVAAYRAAARTILGLPADPALDRRAGWDPATRAAVLGDAVDGAGGEGSSR